MEESSLTSLSHKKKTQPKQSKRKKWSFKWDKNRVLWYYLIALSVLLVYGFFNLDAATQLIDSLVKAMEFIINSIE
jgi:capsule polysaccharide export protein KpsE/RkpR